ncbi:MAG: B12-binding domain-containing radical SAM protein [Candidatus Hodarchaeota archaeon]
MKNIKVLLIEPPKIFWFIMGEYLPPPLQLMQLAAVLEQEDIEVEILDCQAEHLGWRGLERYIETYEPDVVGASGFATCNTYTIARTVEIAKMVSARLDKAITTAVGGAHFTATVEESLSTYPEIDFIVRGEGDQTFPELCKAIQGKRSIVDVKGISFVHDGRIISTPSRPLIKNLDELPSPAFHLLDLSRYHFKMMSDKGYMNIEDSRGCLYNCTFCTCWKHWADPSAPERGCWRPRSVKRIVDEMEFCYETYGIEFFWFTGDNVIVGKRMKQVAQEILDRHLDIDWFIQARVDAVIQQQETLPLMRESGNRWMLLGVESRLNETLAALNKQIQVEQSIEAVKLLKTHDIFAQAMLMIGYRNDTSESIQQTRDFIEEELRPDLAMFMVLTPYPGTALFEEADKKGWIENKNYTNYDMIHAIMPTETLSREEVQHELYRCYHSQYGTWGKRLRGIFSSNKWKRRAWRYLATQGVLSKLRKFF